MHTHHCLLSIQAHECTPTYCQYKPSPCNNPPPKRTEHVLPHSSRRVPLKCFNTCQHCNASPLFNCIELHLFAESSVSTKALKSSPHTKTTTLICNTPRPEQWGALWDIKAMTMYDALWWFDKHPSDLHVYGCMECHTHANHVHMCQPTQHNTTSPALMI